MAGETLPDDLVVKIVAMMPFPSIFKARLLSKSWQARFRSIQSQDDQEQRSRAISFQKEVSESSNRWGTFCHAYSPTEDSLICFDQTLRNWRRLPSLSFLPERVFQAFAVKCYARFNLVRGELKRVKSYLQIEGPLLYGMLEVKPICGVQDPCEELYVVNILTQEYKKLPARPFIFHEIYCVKLVIETSAQTYKLILIGKRHGTRTRESSIQIYDSEANKWSCEGSGALSRLYDAESLSISAYFNGVLYMSTSADVESLLTYNLEERSFTVIRLSTWTGFPLPANRFDANRSRLVVCDGSLMMIVTVRDLLSESDEELSFEDEEQLQSYTVRVLKIDVESQLVMEVAHWCLAVNKFTDVPASQDNHKFFGVTNKLPGLVLAYDECTKEWSYFYIMMDQRFSTVSFQPGLHTFMAV